MVERSTPDRLAGLKELGIGGAKDLDTVGQAQEIFLNLLLNQQVKDIESGTAASNTVAVKTLSAENRSRLRSALVSVQHIDELTHELLFKN